MAKRKTQQQLQWEVLRIKGSPAAFVGIVYAPDEDSATAQAIGEFNVRKEDQKPLLVRRV